MDSIGKVSIDMVKNAIDGIIYLESSNNSDNEALRELFVNTLIANMVYLRKSGVELYKESTNENKPQ